MGNHGSRGGKHPELARAVALAGIVGGCVVSACGGDDEANKPPPATGGSAGRGGSAGTGGRTGSGGTAGAGGTAGRGGSAGTGGAAGRGGSAGTGGSAGASGTAGSNGSGGGGTGGTQDASTDGAIDAPDDASDAGSDVSTDAGSDASDAGAIDANTDATDAPPPPRAFNSQPTWQTAASCATLRQLYFDGATETHNRSVVDGAISPSYLSLGVDFQPFLGTTTYPVIFRNQQFQISIQGHDGLVANNVSPRPASDLQGRAIRASFVTPVSAFGVHTNNGDGGHFDAFDAQDNLILQVPIASGGFGGIVSAVPIKRVAIVNTFNSDIRFGIFGFQFCAP